MKIEIALLLILGINTSLNENSPYMSKECSCENPCQSIEVIYPSLENSYEQKACYEIDILV